MLYELKPLILLPIHVPANSFFTEQIEKSHETVFGRVPDRSSIQPRVSKNSVFILQSLVWTEAQKFVHSTSMVATKMAIE